MNESRKPERARAARSRHRRRDVHAAATIVALAWFMLPGVRASAAVDPPVFTTPQESIVQYETDITGTFSIPGWYIYIGGASTQNSVVVRQDGTWTARVHLWPAGPVTIRALAHNQANTEETAYSGPLLLYVDGSMPWQRVEDDHVHDHGHVYGPDETVPDIQGVAGDDIGVAKIHIRYYDVKGDLVADTIAACSGCGVRGATSVEWSTSLLQQTGFWTVQIATEDLARRGSVPDGFQYLRIANPA
jgi:hypothetical protein